MSAESLPLTEDQIRAVISSIPYAGWLGVGVELRGDELTLALPYKDDLIGNPMLPALHGGAVGAFMELTAVATLSVRQRQLRLPKVIDVTMSYHRSGRPADTFARGVVTKLGRRIAHVRVEAWQQERADPIASLVGHFLVTPADKEPS